MGTGQWIALGVVGVCVAGLAGFAGWLLTLPSDPRSPGPAPPVAAEETARITSALKPPKRERPLVAVVGLNDATETTDYLMTAGILRRANVVDVVLLSINRGPVQLYPAMRVLADATV